MKWKRYSTAAERFLSCVDRSGGCWVWLAGRKATGYGVFNLGKGRPMGAHRAAYILTYGDIPDGMNVCHRCDNRWCVNPAHLFLATTKENMQDASKKGRLNKPRENGWKISAAGRREIVSRSQQGESSRSIAKDFNVSHKAILKVVRKFPDGIPLSPFVTKIRENA